ncbi:L-threonine aldolase [Stella humosa]|uniref:L-threonine aldolase n=1 Tax=Stella humosa TaxID=94 RepID=A0A3N1MAN7_9PROT|nr:low specificity L-threonine aldolase [Stella humosa]ROP99766.1 L-threonine aldolase [Stella humosa]BBK31007.1 L-threonine aldolase [Stella humosa]
MNFASDNTAGAHPAVLQALAEASTGRAMPYGNDPWTDRVAARLAEIFETPVEIFPVATGTACNALALSALTPPWGAVYCHEQAHVEVDECGAPEMFTGGAKLVTLPGQDGRIAPETLAEALDRGGFGSVHSVQPSALSLTQSTECGTVYRPDHLRALCDLAHAKGLGVHMDGARFANAVAALGAAPADITWRAGVDVLSLGATKNGAMAAEAVVFFDRGRADRFAFRRKRAGHLFSKMRFLSAQLEAYLADGLWLANAAHANAMATRLAAGLQGLPGVTLRHPVEANTLFAALPGPAIDAMAAAGFRFYRWPDAGPDTIRLVTAFDTEAADVDAFLAKLQSILLIPAAATGT